ncbi:MAG: hypothetical protein Q4D57_05425 [Clostridia bacterium]|nr:hypothetical protein [Clostridia bacterium]
MDMKQKSRELKRKIRLALKGANTEEITHKNDEIQKNQSIDKETKGKLDKYAQAAVNWKKLQEAIKLAKTYLKGTAGDTSGNGEKDYIENLWDNSVENAILPKEEFNGDNGRPTPYGTFLNRLYGNGGEFRSMKEKLKEILKYQDFEGRGRSMKANRASIQRCMQALRILDHWYRHAQRQKRENKSEFEKLYKESNKK